MKLRLQRAERDLATARVMFEQASACYADANEALGLRIDRAAPEILETARARLAQATRNLSEAREEMRRAEADLRDYPVPAFLAAERKRGTVMIAVTGGAGVGKSSLVNALCGFRPNDPVGADTGVVETTCEPLMYRLPGHTRILRSLAEEKAEVCMGDRLLLCGADGRLEGTVAEVVSVHSEDTWTARLEDGTDIVVGSHDLRGALVSRAIWDLPGVGTNAFPQETYLKRMGIRHFDAVILVTASRFTEADVMLLDELRHWKVPFLLVRNKIDMDVQQEIERESDFCFGDPDYGGSLTEHRRQEIMRQVVVQVREHLKSLHSLEHVYCLSARRKFKSEFDFGSLEAGITSSSESQRAAAEEDEELLLSGSASEALAAEALSSVLGRN